MVSINPLNWFKKEPVIPSISVDDLKKFSYGQYADYTGDKFAGGFGITKLYNADYWTLRERSSQLFTDNLYARGVIRRLVTNVINVGLSLEACPEEKVLGLTEDSLVEWTDTVENRFNLWGKNPNVCDKKQLDTFGEVQRAAYREALIEGDILVVLHFLANTKAPSVQLIKGGSVRNPFNMKLRKGNVVKHGIEFDSQGHQVAFYVDNKRIPAYGEKSGRKIAWMVYASDKRMDDVRGFPLLALLLQSLKEIDRYRDSAQRKAVINSLLAMFIEKGENKIGTKPLTAAASKKETIQALDEDGSTRTYQVAEQNPGIVIENLQQGEKPTAFGGQGTDVNFGEFEASIIRAVAWANEIPPEILQLSFASNYSASQAALQEFKMFLDPTRLKFGENFCQPIYTEWLINEVLVGRVAARGLLEAWRDKSKHDIFGSWISADWMGAIKPSTDIKKQAQGQKILVDEGWSNNTKVAREISSTKFSKNIKKIKQENILKADALRPLLSLKKEYGDSVEAELNKLEAQNER